MMRLPRLLRGLQWRVNGVEFWQVPVLRAWAPDGANWAITVRSEHFGPARERLGEADDPKPDVVAVVAPEAALSANALSSALEDAGRAYA